MTGFGTEDVIVDVHGPEDGSVTAEDVRRAVLRVLEGEAEGVGSGEVSVAFLGDEDIRDLNLRYLGNDRPTDVLAFRLDGAGGQGEAAIAEGAATGGEGGDAPPSLVGDVYVGLEQARSQAEGEGRPLREELLRLVVHGVLHVLGHDHPEGPEREASPMYRRQEELLEGILGEPGKEGEQSASRGQGRA